MYAQVLALGNTVATTRRPTLPVLHCILIEADDDII
jgi:DNA polymerase III sliding clamp (beta) subunit (PCNA family)